MGAMTIGQALAELKMLAKRINRAIQEAEFLTIVSKDTEDKIVVQMRDRCKGNWQRVDALMKRYFDIKRKVVRSNAETVIEIGPRKMTVAEAIELKNRILWHQELAVKLDGEYRLATTRADQHNEALEKKAIELFSAGSGESKSVDLDGLNAYVNSRKWYVTGVPDPQTKIEELNQFLDVFQRNIDAQLNASNALTTIEVGEES